MSNFIDILGKNDWFYQTLTFRKLEFILEETINLWKYPKAYMSPPVPKVLKPNDIEPTFLKLDSKSPGAGFNPIITFNVLN